MHRILLFHGLYDQSPVMVKISDASSGVSKCQGQSFKDRYVWNLNLILAFLQMVCHPQAQNWLKRQMWLCFSVTVLWLLMILNVFLNQKMSPTDWEDLVRYHDTFWLGHYGDITWASRRLKSPASRLCVQQLLQANTSNKAWNSRMTGPLWGNPPATGEFL